MNDLDAVAREYQVPLYNFAEVAGRYCALIEDWYAHTDGSDIYELLEKIDVLLGELYWRGTQLPEMDVWYSDEGGDEDEDEEDGTGASAGSHQRTDDLLRVALQESGEKPRAVGLMYALSKHLGSLNFRRDLFDPYHKVFEAAGDDGDAIIDIPLDNNLSDIYGWCKRGLVHMAIGDGQDIFEAGFGWRLGFDLIEGRTLTGAMRALHFALHFHSDDDWVRLPDPRSYRNPPDS